MARTSVEVQGIPGLIDLFQDAVDAVDTSAIFEEVGAVLLNRIRTRFLNETDPDGVPWPESNAARIRRAKGRGGGTLFDTGALFNSIQLFRRANDTLGIGTDVVYAKKLQEGEEGLPPRVFLGFSDEDVSVVNRVIINRINKALGD